MAHGPRPACQLWLARFVCAVGPAGLIAYVMLLVLIPVCFARPKLPGQQDALYGAALSALFIGATAALTDLGRIAGFLATLLAGCLWFHPLVLLARIRNSPEVSGWGDWWVSVARITLWLFTASFAATLAVWWLDHRFGGWLAARMTRPRPTSRLPGPGAGERTYRV